MRSGGRDTRPSSLPRSRPLSLGFHGALCDSFFCGEIAGSRLDVHGVALAGLHDGLWLHGGSIL